MTVKEIKSLDEFRQIIGSSTPAVIDFWATWCGPCRIISPVFEKFSDSEEFSGVQFYKVDVDDQQGIAQEVGVKAMPTFMLFKDGDKKGEAVGANPQKVQQLVASGKSFC